MKAAGIFERNEVDLVRSRLRRALELAAERLRAAHVADASGVPADAVWLVSVPSVSPHLESLVARAGAEPVAVIVPPRGRCTVAVGEVATFEAAGAARFTGVQAWAAELARGALCIGALKPRFVGGFAFDAHVDEAWQPFAAARFCLPRWLFTFDGTVQAERRGWLSLAGRGDIDVAARLAEFDARFGDSVVGPAAVVPAIARSTAARRTPSATRESAAWRARVRSALELIEDGTLTKVVCARQSRFVLGEPLDLPKLIAAAQHNGRDSTLFLFARASVAFVGVTPERLVRVWEGNVFSEALAGTAGIDEADGATRLMRSGKERAEHRIVVDSIMATLRPLCAEVEVTPTHVRRLPSVMHLHATVRGQLREPQHVLAMVERLHPTPAIGGLPSRAARAFIHETEGVSRGWYAGSIGWFDNDGEGEFHVALRCAYLREGVAHLYAGAGIVAGSEPESEWQETERKLDVMRALLQSKERRRPSVDEARA